MKASEPGCFGSSVQGSFQDCISARFWGDVGMRKVGGVSGNPLGSGNLPTLRVMTPPMHTPPMENSDPSRALKKQHMLRAHHSLPELIDQKKSKLFVYHQNGPTPKSITSMNSGSEITSIRTLRAVHS